MPINQDGGHVGMRILLSLAKIFITVANCKEEQVAVITGEIFFLQIAGWPFKVLVLWALKPRLPCTSVVASKSESVWNSAFN